MIWLSQARVFVLYFMYCPVYHRLVSQCARLPDNCWLDWAKFCWAPGPGRAAPRPARPARARTLRLLCRAGRARGICHTQSEWHIMWTHSGQHGSCFTPSPLPDQMFKRLGLTFCCGLEVTGWRAQLTQPLPSRTFCKIILFTSQISKLLLSPFKYRAGKIFSRKWKVLTDERRATYLVFTRYTQVMVMRLTSS